MHNVHNDAQMKLFKGIAAACLISRVRNQVKEYLIHTVANLRQLVQTPAHTLTHLLPSSEVSRKGSPLQGAIAGTQYPDMMSSILQLKCPCSLSANVRASCHEVFGPKASLSSHTSCNQLGQCSASWSRPSDACVFVTVQPLKQNVLPQLLQLAPKGAEIQWLLIKMMMHHMPMAPSKHGVHQQVSDKTRCTGLHSMLGILPEQQSAGRNVHSICCKRSVGLRLSQP